MKRADINAQFEWDLAIRASIISNGRKYIDFTSGIFCANVGHRNLTVQLAVLEAINRIGPHTYTYATQIRRDYERELLRFTGFDAVHLFTTGSEAVEAAMRLCQMRYGGIYSGPYECSFACLEGTFHGKTWGPREILWPQKESMLPRRGVVAIIEGYRGWDCHFWSRDSVLKPEDSEKIHIWDEIQSGFGRTGTKFAYEQYVVTPDIMVIGKGMCNGYPGSAVLANGKWAETLEANHDEFSSTHGGNPITCAAGLAVIEEYERLGLPNQDRCKQLQDGLRAIWPNTNGRGMVAAMLTETEDQATNIVLAARAAGLLLVHTGKASVKIGPPLTITEEQLTEGLTILKGVVCAMQG